MLSEKLLSVFVVVAVIGITVGYFVVVEPEDTRVSSADGIVTVTGVSRETQPLMVQVGGRVELPEANLAYDITPDTVTLDEPVVVTFKLFKEQSAVSALSVYRKHPVLNMWEPVSSVVARTPETMAIETAQLGAFTLASVSRFEAPVFVNVYDELRQKAPSDAVGYEIAVGFQDKNQETVRLLDVGEQGGCAGTVRVGDGEELSRVERQAEVLMNDKQTILTFVFVTRWFTSSTGGCGVEEPLRPLTEYDILNEIHT